MPPRILPLVGSVRIALQRDAHTDANIGLIFVGKGGFGLPAPEHGF